MKEAEPAVTKTFATFTIGTEFAQIPTNVVDFAKLRILDTIAGMVAGSRFESTRIALRFVDGLGTRPEASIVGHHLQAAAAYAAFANGVAAHAAEYDETFVSDDSFQGQHLSSCVLPAALALAEARRLSGRQLLSAYVVGCEVGARLSIVSRKTMGGTLFGYHPSIVAVFGAGAAAANVLKLDRMQTQYAFGLVASEAAGLRKQGGTHAKAFQMGQAARNGVVAAQLAELGLKSDPEMLDNQPGTGHDHFGFFETHFRSGNYSTELIGDGLGQEWQQLFTVTKLRPGLIRTVSVDLALEMLRDHDLTPDQVDRVDVGVTSVQNLGPTYRYPRDEQHAVFSIWYNIAVAILDRVVGLSQFTKERVERADVRPMLERIHFSVDAECDRDYRSGADPFGASARVTMTLKDGTQLSRAGRTRRGFLDSPASWDDIVRKLRDCAAFGSQPNAEFDVEQIVSLVAQLDELPKADALAAALTRRPSG